MKKILIIITLLVLTKIPFLLLKKEKDIDNFFTLEDHIHLNEVHNNG